MQIAHEISFQELADLLGLLANRSRLQILVGVLRDECNVSRIQERLGLPQASVSRHLATLKRARLVQSRREGVRICYRVIHPLVRRLLDVLGITPESPGSDLDTWCERLRVLSNPTRLRILVGLQADECNLKGIQEKLDLPQSTASQHLTLLRDLELIHPLKRDGRTCYQVTGGPLREILELLG